MPGKTKETAKVKQTEERGRPPIEINYKLLEQMAQMQATHEEIAGVFGCARSTISTAIANDPLAKEAFERGKASGLISLRRALYAAASRGSDRVLVHLSKVYLKNMEVARVETTGKDGDLIRLAHGFDQEQYRKAREEILKEY